MHRTPAGLPFGIPGIEEDMLGAIQQAPHPSRQFIETYASKSENKGADGNRKNLLLQTF